MMGMGHNTMPSTGLLLAGYTSIPTNSLQKPAAHPNAPQHGSIPSVATVARAHAGAAHQLTECMRCHQSAPCTAQQARFWRLPNNRGSQLEGHGTVTVTVMTASIWQLRFTAFHHAI